MIELLSTKLFIPRPRTNLVSRPRLNERMNAGLDKKLTLIAAPAGFGKTTLLSEWIPQSPRCVTWLSLDDADNDPTLFWAYFISSLQSLRPDLGASALALLQSPQSPPLPAILTALINELSAFPDTFAIVLEDCHFIEFQPIYEGLTFLIEHLPANMHLVITTRVDPPLPLARLRARDKLTELRANDLRFTAEEAAAFLNQVMGLDLSVEGVAALEKRTEGWVAGLQIAALSMQSQDNAGEFIQAFSGSHRHILGYLADEVLNQRPKGTLDFLLQTSILERLCGPLCEAVTGNLGGQETLEELEHANLFISALDDEGTWYRYHPLFAEVLRARLERSQGERIPELHRRARNWYAQQDMMNEAVRHALAGADFAEAAQLVTRITPTYIHRGELKTLLSWIDRLPADNVFCNGELLSYKGWLLYLTGQVDRAMMHADKAQVYITQDTTSVARGRLALLNSQCAIVNEDITTANEYAMEALDLIGEEDSFFKSLALTTLSGIQTLVGDTREAIDNLREAARIGEEVGQPLATLSAYARLADQLNWHGKLQEGRSICKHAMSLYVDPSGQPSPISGIAFIEGAKLAYEENDIDLLNQYLGAAISQEEFLGMTGLTFEIIHVQTLADWAAEEVDAALAKARQGRLLAEKVGLKGYASMFAGLEADLSLKIENRVAVENWIKATNISNAKSNDLLHINESIVFARCLITQNRLSDATELLKGLEETVVRAEYTRHLIAILILKSLLFQRQHDYSRANENLERALQLAAPQNYRRVFIDEGEVMRVLLADFQSNLRKKMGTYLGNSSPPMLAYTEKLLAGFSQPTPIATQKPETSIDALSERELEILRLISMGLTNQEIAHTLVIAVSTVKTHINSLYGKLGTKRRTQAMAIARDLGLLSE